MSKVVFIDSQVFTWVILPILIFLARVVDVSIGTVRIMLVSRGRKIIAPILGFIEMMIWLLAVRQVIQNVANVICYFSFAGGFAMGNYVGMLIEEKLAMGLIAIRVITRKDAAQLIGVLEAKNYGVTSLDAHGTTGKVNLIFMIINRKDLEDVIALIEKFSPKAFYSVEDIRSVNEGVFPRKKQLKAV